VIKWKLKGAAVNFLMPPLFLILKSDIMTA
jgi:hypothetical protein